MDNRIFGSTLSGRSLARAFKALGSISGADRTLAFDPVSGAVGTLSMTPLFQDTRPVVNLLGNSIDAQANNYSDAATPTGNYLQSGYCAWMLTLSHQRIKLPKLNSVFGYPGKSVGEFIEPTLVGKTGGLASVLANKPAVLILGCATNNIVRSDGQQIPTNVFNGVTIGSTYYPGYIDAITRARAAGIKHIIIRPIGPRADVTLTGTQIGAIVEVNRRLLEITRLDNGIFVPDYVKLLVDPSSAIWAPASGVLNSGDNLHPNTGRGQFYMGKAIAAIINRLIPQVDLLTPNAAVYANPQNVYGNLAANPMFTGTGGTNQNFEAGSVVPNSWTVNKIAGDSSALITSSVTPSTVDPAYSAVQLAYSGTFTGAGTGSAIDVSHVDRLLCAVSGTKFAPGETAVAYVGVEVDAGAAGICVPSLRLRDNAGVSYNEAIYPGLGGQLPNEAWSGVLGVQPFTLPVGAASSFLSCQVFRAVDVTGAVTVSGSIRFTRPSLYKVIE